MWLVSGMPNDCIAEQEQPSLAGGKMGFEKTCLRVESVRTT